jgi:hypothetical protein
MGIFDTIQLLMCGSAKELIMIGDKNLFRHHTIKLLQYDVLTLPIENNNQSVSAIINSITLIIPVRDLDETEDKRASKSNVILILAVQLRSMVHKASCSFLFHDAL